MSIVDQFVQGGCGDSVGSVSGALSSEEANTCFVLPLQEALVHFASRNTRSTYSEMGSSDNGDACTSILDTPANFGVGFLSHPDEHGG
jgi:hypothetical protein